MWIDKISFGLEDDNTKNRLKDITWFTVLQNSRRKANGNGKVYL